VRRKLVPSRSAAQHAIAAGLVEVDGVVAPKPATMVASSVRLKVVEPPAPFVSRGGLKLQHALDVFPITVTDRRALDVGASTGGFTDCLLQAGAQLVVALDVGYGQLDWSLRNHQKVEVVERTNIRHADLSAIGAPFDLVVADLSFIGLTTVASHLAAAGHGETDYIVLVKPQFEVGKDLVGKGGIVRDGAVHRRALEMVAAAFDDVGLGAAGVVRSPITGAKGNREFLLWAKPGRSAVGSGAFEEVTAGE
jgi:23S rRNA (cytidine1920-2'-O)/16S rRNA (cytidine1409-2'-O)-methyltransferase